MRPFCFVHAADLHLDSPFRGVSAEAAPEAVTEALYASTFQAYEALVDLAVDRADFLVVAGDVYDGQDRSLRAQLRLRDGLARLSDAGISAFLVHGNHDPLDSHASRLSWPETVHVFGSRVSAVPAGAADGDPLATICGVSFARREETRNLATGFSRQEGSGFHVGLLHANVGADTGHENYAPCSLDDLRAAGMDYWALGHVHTRSVLSEAPWVVYPGNLQGRSIRELGPRGVFLVTVDEAGHASLEFVALDRVRWARVEVSIEGVDTVDALERALQERLSAAVAAGQGRALVCRVSVTGRGPLHHELRREGAAAQLLERLREGLADADPCVWVQRLGIDTRPRVDVAERRSGHDLLSEVLAAAEACRKTPADLDALYRKALAALWENPRFARARLGAPAHDEIQAIRREAELLCQDLLEETE